MAKKNSISGKGNKNDIKKMKLLHWNCNGIVGKEKFNKIENLLRFEKPDFLSLNETKTNATTCSYLFELSKMGYFPIFRN